MMHHRRFIVTPKTCHRVVVPTFFGLSIAILFFFCPAVISCCLCRHTSQIMCNQLRFSSDFCHKNGVIVTWNKTEKQVFQTLKREHLKGEKKSFISLSIYSKWLFQSNQIDYNSYYLMIFGHQDISDDWNLKNWNY